MVSKRRSIPSALLHGRGTEFVGRSRELRQLSTIWDSVSAGNRHVVFVGGEPGAGKSRLVAETAMACFDDGAKILLGSNTRDLGYALQPFAEVIDYLFADERDGPSDALSDETLASLARLSRTLSSRIGVASSPPLLDDPAELYAAVTELFKAIAAEAPVVLVLENMHWAGAYTLQLLMHLVQSTADESLLIMGTHRTTAPDRTDELTLSIAEMYGLAGVSRIDLAGLDAEDIAHYLVAASGAPLSQARRAAAVLRDQTGGNPFFLEEAWRELEREGGLKTLTAHPLRAPLTVRDMLELRLQALPPAALAVLEHAAIAGDRIDLDLLVSIGLSLDEVLSAIDVGFRFGFLTQEADNTPSFRHSLSRQAVVHRMPRRAQIEIHAHVAQAIESRESRTPEALAALAHHYSEAAALGHEAKAASFLAQSATASRVSLAHEEAATSFERAAAMASGGQAAELMFEAATSLSHAGRLSEARHRYLELASTEDPRQLAQAAIGFEEAAWEQNAEPATSIDLLTTALRGLDDDDPTRIRAMASLGRALRLAGAFEQGRALGEKALQLARQANDQELIAHALMGLVQHMSEPSELLVHMDRCVELTDLGYSSRAHMKVAMGVGGSASTAYRLGWNKHFRDMVQVEEIVRTSGQPFVALSQGCLLFMIAFMEGNFDSARDRANRLLADGTPFDQANAAGVHGMQMFLVQRASGALARLPKQLVTTAITDNGWPPGVIAVYTELGMRDEVAHLLPSIILACEETPIVSAGWAALAVFAVEAIGLLGDRDGAERMRELLMPFQSTNLLSGHLVLPLGSADLSLGILDHVLELPSATEHFEVAVEMNRKMGSVVHEAETLLSYGAHLDAIAETVKAADVRRRGMTIATRIGLQRRIPLDQGPGLSVDLTGESGLSPREIDVLRLLTLGMSNREIGVELMISANTAANHIRSILMKTGSNNRTQAAVYAAKHGLT